MTHSDAVERNLTERYLLSELDEAEREEFELHFFSCKACTADLGDGIALIDAGKGILKPPRAEEASPRESFWTRWLPRPAWPALAAVSAAFVLMTANAVYQFQRNRALTGELAEFSRPRQTPELPLMEANRGSARTVQVPYGTREIQLMIDVGSDEPFRFYRCEFRAASGGLVSSAQLNPIEPGRPIPVLAPVSLLASGETAIRVVGVRADGSEQELVSHMVKVQVQESSR